VSHCMNTNSLRGWAGKKDFLNPFTELTPLELCEELKLAALAIHSFCPAMTQIQVPSELEYSRPK
jgi:hypothetical protein